MEVKDEVVAGPAGSRPAGIPAEEVIPGAPVPATTKTVPLDVYVLVNAERPETARPPTLTYGRPLDVNDDVEAGKAGSRPDGMMKGVVVAGVEAPGAPAPATT